MTRGERLEGEFEGLALALSAETLKEFVREFGD